MKLELLGLGMYQVPAADAVVDQESAAKPSGSPNSDLTERRQWTHRRQLHYKKTIRKCVANARASDYSRRPDCLDELFEGIKRRYEAHRREEEARNRDRMRWLDRRRG